MTQYKAFLYKHTATAVFAGLLGFSAATTSLVAKEIYSETNTNDQESESSSFLSDWWYGEYATGNWFGVRDTLEDNGIKLGGKYYGAFFGVVDSQGGNRGFWDQGLEFKGEINTGKLLKVDQLKGVKLFGAVRWRDDRGAADPNTFVEATSMFKPSNWISGMGWRLLNFGIEIGSDEYLPIEDMIVFRAGWIQPQKEFVDQPLSKLFLNNAINSSKGIGGNIPFGSSFSTWGGSLEVKPAEWAYVKGGLFMSYPSGAKTQNHGLAFQGYAEDTSQNGLMTILETGVKPKIGPNELPGHYAMGGYYYGGEADSFNGTSQYGQYGFYWQADQMLFREPSASVEEPAPTGKDTVDYKSSNKSFKSPVSTEKPKLSDQGLSMFNFVSFAPKYNNIFPFYFHTGLVYKGLIPTRDADLTMIALGYGSYSYYNTLAQRAQGSSKQPNYPLVIEGGYRVQINKWAFVQPFIQYIIRPNGTNNVQNATVLGVYTGINF
ncbi:MAG: carbohydrate porin [Chthoniobacterales bacterium]